MVVAAPSDPEHLPFLVAEAQVFPAELALTWGSKAFLYRMTTVILYKNSHFYLVLPAGASTHRCGFFVPRAAQLARARSQATVPPALVATS